MIVNLLIVLFLIGGSLFIFLSSIGLLRFPDLYTRMHATTKSSTMGLMLMLIAVCIFEPGGREIFTSFLILAFVFATKPIGAHAIARAGHIINVKKWEGSTGDDLDEEDRMEGKKD